MFLGIMNFGHTGFCLFGALGYVVTILYFMFILYYRKSHANGFEFSMIVFIVYYIFILSKVFNNNIGLTFSNILWFIPFVLCIIVEALVYIIKRYFTKKG